eukprot:4209202-Prymnesium_polylepis.1
MTSAAAAALCPSLSEVARPRSPRYRLTAHHRPCSRRTRDRSAPQSARSARYRLTAHHRLRNSLFRMILCSASTLHLA